MTASDYRKDFPLLQNEDTIYIDNAATAQRPQAVLDAVRVFYETEGQYVILFMRLPKKRLFLQEIQQKG